MDCTCYSSPERPCISRFDVRTFRQNCTMLLQPAEVISGVTVTQNSVELSVSGVRVVPGTYYDSTGEVAAGKAVEAVVDNIGNVAGDYFVEFEVTTATDVFRIRSEVQYAQ